MALALDRLQRSQFDHEMHVSKFSFTVVDAPTVIARDGEVGDKLRRVTFAAQYRSLPVLRLLSGNKLLRGPTICPCR